MVTHNSICGSDSSQMKNILCRKNNVMADISDFERMDVGGACIAEVLVTEKVTVLVIQ